MLVIVCYVLMYSGGCIVMPWWVVGEGNVVNGQCYYRVCETADRNCHDRNVQKNVSDDHYYLTS